MSEDAGFETRTVATLVVAKSRSNYSPRSQCSIASKDRMGLAFSILLCTLYTPVKCSYHSSVVDPNLFGLV